MSLNDVLSKQLLLYDIKRAHPSITRISSSMKSKYSQTVYTSPWQVKYNGCVYLLQARPDFVSENFA